MNHAADSPAGGARATQQGTRRGFRATHPKVLEPKVLDPKVLVTKVLGSLNKGINWLYPVSDVKSLIGFTAYFGN